MAEILVGGGIGPYMLEYNGPQNGRQTLNIEGMITLEQLPPGNYVLNLSDANNCTTQCSFNIGDIGCSLSVNVLAQDPGCSGSDGSIQLSISGANGDVVFDWSDDALDGQSQLTGLRGGSYAVTVSDASGCTNELAIDLAETKILELEIEQQYQVRRGDSVLLTALTNFCPIGGHLDSFRWLKRS